MKRLNKFFVAALAAFLMAACGGGAETSTGGEAGPAASESPAAEAQAAPEASKSPEESSELPKSDLKPDAVSKNTPVEITDLRNAVAADPEAWKGVEVSVKGDYNGHSTSTTSYGKTIMMNIRNKEYKNAGTCIGKDEPPADVKERRQDRVFTGKVGRYLKSFQQVEIEECKMTG